LKAAAYKPKKPYTRQEIPVKKEENKTPRKHTRKTPQQHTMIADDDRWRWRQLFLLDTTKTLKRQKLKTLI
jgi:hypothetical protein